jgi:hypothetical protein
MRRPSGSKEQLVVGVAALLALLSLVAVILDLTGLAVLSVVALQELVLVAVLFGRGGGSRIEATLKRQAEDLAQLHRQINNVGLRVVEESLAIERAIRSPAPEQEGQVRDEL